MLDILRQFVSTNTTPETLEAIEDAHDLFDRLEIPNYQQEFESFLMLDDVTDNGSTIEAIYDLTKTMQHQILSDHAMIVDKECQVSLLNIFIRGILDIQEYEDKEEIIRTTELDGSPEEIMADILALVTSLTASELLIHIERVNQFTITRIREIAENKDDLPLDDEQTEEIMKRVSKLNLFCLLVNNYNLKISFLLQHGLQANYPFTVYADMLKDDMEGMTPEQLAMEWYGMGIMSCDGFDNVPAIIKNNIDHYLSDIDEITKITMTITDYQIALER